MSSRKLLVDIDTVHRELLEIEATASGLKTRAVAIEGEVDHLVGRMHKLSNYYYELRERLMVLIAVHIPDDAEAAAAVPDNPSTLPIAGHRSKKP